MEWVSDTHYVARLQSHAFANCNRDNKLSRVPAHAHAHAHDRARDSTVQSKYFILIATLQLL
jgi:hypothetical protein